jgi:hypothetical protein
VGIGLNRQNSKSASQTYNKDHPAGAGNIEACSTDRADDKDPEWLVLVVLAQMKPLENLISSLNRL